MNVDLIKELLIVAITLSVFVTAVIQKVKASFKFKKTEHITLCSFVFNIVLSICFCKSFTDINFLNSLWVGLFSFVGADTIYKTLEEKLNSYSDIVAKREKTEVIEIKRDDV